MNAVTDIVKEFEEMGSPLAKMPRVSPFIIPENYFSSFADTIQNIISESDPELNLPKTMPFDLPENYFEQFSNSILDKVTQPVFGKTEAPTFDVPAGYFENFSANILATAKAAATETHIEIAAPVEEKKTKTISFRPQKVIRWAAAAVLILGVGFGSYKIIDGQSASPELSAEKQLAMLDKTMISNYVQQHIDEFDTELLAETSTLGEEKPEKSIHKLNKKDIEQYLDVADGEDVGIN